MNRYKSISISKEKGDKEVKKVVKKASRKLVKHHNLMDKK